MKRTSSKTREEISRREFAKLMSAPIFAAPLAIPVAGEQTKRHRSSSRSQSKRPTPVRILSHIPPIDMMNGSFIVRTGEPLEDDIPNDHSRVAGRRPRKHQCPYGEVKWARVIAANGNIEFDGYKNDAADRAQIEIWFERSPADDANILIRKEDGTDPHMAIETKMKLVSEAGSSGVFRYRRRYNDPNVQIKYVRITKPGATPVLVSSGEELQIEHILVWTY